jgi:hypothetical protein
MKKRIFAVAVMLSVWIPIQAAHAGWSDFLNELKSAVMQEDTLTNGEIVDGLKQALSVGTQKAVGYVSKT